MFSVRKAIMAGTILVGAIVLSSNPASAAHPASMYDFDANGYYDPYVNDFNRNGILDQNVLRTPTGQLLWLFDVNENSWPDQYGADANGDGAPDMWFLDNNEDTVMDQVLTDPKVHGFPTLVLTGGSNRGLPIRIDYSHLQVSPANILAPIENLMGTGGITDTCTFLNSAALIGSGFSCIPAYY